MNFTRVLSTRTRAVVAIAVTGGWVLLDYDRQRLSFLALGDGFGLNVADFGLVVLPVLLSLLRSLVTRGSVAILFCLGPAAMPRGPNS